MVLLERYDRQERIPGWQQEKLSRAKITVIGSDRLSDLLLVDLLSLGIGNITRIGQSDFFDFDKINPQVYLEQRDEQLASQYMAKSVLEDSDIIINSSNEERTNHFSREAAKFHNKVHFSAFCDKNSFTLGLSSDFSASSSDYEGAEQGIFPSLIASGILADEIRKRLMPLENDLLLTELKQTFPDGKGMEKRVIQIGAGAIGTFSAISLINLGADLTLVDFDVIEETNLNRQFLFYNANGRNKAITLKERLQKYSKREIKVREEKIGEDFDPSGFDYVFCCVDNNLARYHINRACAKYKVPFINGGSSINAGQASSYLPGKTRCLDCQTGFKLSEATNPVKRSSGACFQPSLIIPNQVVAGMMLSAAHSAQAGFPKKYNFSSGSGIFEQDIERDCYDSCQLRGNK